MTHKHHKNRNDNLSSYGSLDKYILTKVCGINRSELQRNTYSVHKSKTKCNYAESTSDVSQISSHYFYQSNICSDCSTCMYSTECEDSNTSHTESTASTASTAKTDIESLCKSVCKSCIKNSSAYHTRDTVKHKRTNNKCEMSSRSFNSSYFYIPEQSCSISSLSTSSSSSSSSSNNPSHSFDPNKFYCKDYHEDYHHKNVDKLRDFYSHSTSDCCGSKSYCQCSDTSDSSRFKYYNKDCDCSELECLHVILGDDVSELSAIIEYHKNAIHVDWGTISANTYRYVSKIDQMTVIRYVLLYCVLYLFGLA
jgi:hypothetical protein